MPSRWRSPHTPMGKLTVRPVLVGVRRTWVRDPLSFDVAGAAGPSFNSFEIAPEARPFVDGGSGSVSADANVSFAWRLQLSTWHDFNERFAIRGALSYAYAQPEITFTSRHSRPANLAERQLGAVRFRRRLPHLLRPHRPPPRERCPSRHLLRAPRCRMMRPVPISVT